MASFCALDHRLSPATKARTADTRYRLPLAMTTSTTTTSTRGQMRCTSCSTGTWAGGWLCMGGAGERSEEHTSELQSHSDLVCRLLLEKKNKSRDYQDIASGAAGGLHKDAENQATTTNDASGSTPIQVRVRRDLAQQPPLPYAWTPVD